MESNGDLNQGRNIVFVPGLRQPVKRLAPLVEAFTERGINLIIPGSTKGISVKSLDADFHNKTSEWPLIQLAKANGLYRTLRDTEESKMDIVGYCEGGVTATILASIHPELVNQIVLVNPAGLTNEDGPDRLVSRFRNKNQRYAKLIIQRLVTGRIDSSIYEMAWANVNRTLGMKALASLSEVYMAETLNQLANEGMRISLIHGYKDRLYPYETVSSNVPLTIGAHASFVDAGAGHSVFQTHTKDAVDSVVELLNQER